MRLRRWLILPALLASLVALFAALDLVRQEGDRRLADWREPQLGAVALDRNGALLRVFPVDAGRWRMDVALADVDPRFLTMLLAWEDRRFERHSGIDWLAIGRAAWQSVRHGRIVSGGSTLTMQVARMVRGLPTGSMTAKLEQAVVALALERRFTKDEIAVLYLRLAPYGGPVEGIRAASLAWFGKEPRRLTAGEAALLVALPQAPERIRPDLYPDRAERARNRVLARMAELGVLSQAEADRARREPIPHQRRAMPMMAAHLTDRLRRENPGRMLYRLTIDAGLQARMEDYARRESAGLPGAAGLAMMVGDYRTGEVLAQVGSADMFDRARQGYVDLTRARRSPGSTLKPLIYGLAFERGVAHPESLVDDRPASFAGYRPQNFDHGYEGVMTVRRALQLSRNLPAVELLRAVGPARLVQRMRRAGATPELGSNSLPGLAIGLGGLGISLEDLLRLYGGLANGGLTMPLSYEEGPRQGGHRMLSQTAAWYVTSVLAGAPTTASGPPGSLAYKTGTSYGYRDAWSLGYDGRYVAGVWVGRPDGVPVPGLVGQDAALPLLKGVFSRLGGAERLPGPPPGILAAGNARLPAHMRKVGTVAGRFQPADAPQIVYPPVGARVELAPGALGAQLSLKVRGGRPPFTWYIGGRPALSGIFGREAAYRLASAGFADISVIDSDGVAASTTVFVDQPGETQADAQAGRGVVEADGGPMQVRDGGHH